MLACIVDAEAIRHDIEKRHRRQGLAASAVVVADEERGFVDASRKSIGQRREFLDTAIRADVRLRDRLPALAVEPLDAHDHALRDHAARHVDDVNRNTRHRSNAAT